MQSHSAHPIPAEGDGRRRYECIHEELSGRLCQPSRRAEERATVKDSSLVKKTHTGIQEKFGFSCLLSPGRKTRKAKAKPQNTGRRAEQSRLEYRNTNHSVRRLPIQLGNRLLYHSRPGQAEALPRSLKTKARRLCCSQFPALPLRLTPKAEMSMHCGVWREVLHVQLFLLEESSPAQSLLFCSGGSFENNLAKRPFTIHPAAASSAQPPVVAPKKAETRRDERRPYLPSPGTDLQAHAIFEA